jgi:pyruvate dehydrogenase E2 component (dihydrolipoamide acetyltransferase)
MPELVMPKMGDAMEEGTILKWLKNEGDQLREGDIVAEIQTEKATIEIPATDAGVLSRILVKEGDTVPVGAPIAQVGGNGTAPAAARTPEKAAPKPAAPEARQDREQVPGTQAPTPASPDGDLEHRSPNAAAPEVAPSTNGDRVKASPLARKVAADRGIDLRNVKGTGPGGRIIEADVEEALRTLPGGAPAPSAPAIKPAPAPVLAGTERPLSPMRKVIARRLTESKQSIPHFYLTLDVDMRAAWRLRSEFNAGVDEDRKISFNDLVVRAVALALEKHPALNSRLEGDVIKTPAEINVGVAVSLDEGLIVPVVRNANQKSISNLGKEVRALAERARANQLKPDEYAGGTFTVSNLGMYDITQFNAIINAPEAAILAVGAIRQTPIVEGEQVVPGRQMYLTISVDHRIVDGQVAAVFMQELKRLLEKPMALLG